MINEETAEQYAKTSDNGDLVFGHNQSYIGVPPRSVTYSSIDHQPTKGVSHQKLLLGRPNSAALF